MCSSPDSGELRRDPPPPDGASAPLHRALPPDRGVSSPSPPIAAIAVELRPSRSCPCGLIYSSELCWSSCPRSTVLAVLSLSPRRLDGCCNPDVAAVLCLAARPLARCRPLRRCSFWTVASLPQPRLRHRVAALVFYLAPLGTLLWVSSSPPSFCVLTMVAWPASQACSPMLLLCHAVAAALLKLVLLLLLFCSSLCC
jgi:hypothetical protein